MNLNLGEWIRRSRRSAPWPAGPAGQDAPQPNPLPAHVGLWLDRCLWEQPGDEQKGKPGRRALYDAAIKSLQGSGAALRAYAPLYQRWLKTVADQGAEVERLQIPVTAGSRVLLHPATGATVTEGAVLLHHSYGVPYLPGSALKGLCRAQARALAGVLREEDERQKPSQWIGQLFGWQPAGASSEPADPEDEAAADPEASQGEAGIVDFWDALLVAEPEAQHEGALALDIVNPHHSDYYTSAGAKEPHETDEPVPTHHLTVRPGARFLVVLEMRKPSAPQPGARTAAECLAWVRDQLLLPALAELGIGARTAAGYGRLAPPTAAPAATAAAPPVAARSEGVLDVYWEPGSQTLTVVHTTGKATARQAEAQRLIAALPEALQKSLTSGKKTARLKVTWTTLANAATIVALGPP